MVEDKTIAEIKERVNKRITLSNIVEAIFSQVDKNKIGEGTFNLTKYFYDLCQNEKYKKLLEDLHFNTFYPTPYSEQLDEIVTRLCASTIFLGGDTFYLIKKQYLIKSFEKLDTEKQKLVKEFAAELSKKLKPLEGIE